MSEWVTLGKTQTAVEPRLWFADVLSHPLLARNSFYLQPCISNLVPVTYIHNAQSPQFPELKSYSQIMLKIYVAKCSQIGKYKQDIHAVDANF